jgi:glycine cleavage system H protein
MIVLRGCEFPPDRFYHVEYNVWVQQTAKDIVTIGATAFGAALAIEFFALTPKALGTKIEAGRAVGLLELSKTVVSVRSPIAGTLVEINQAAMARPGIISADPYGEGWLVRLATPTRLADEAQLLTGDAVIAPFEAAMALENFEGRPA